MNDGSPSGAPKFSGTQIQLLSTTIALEKVVMTTLLYSLYHTWVGVQSPPQSKVTPCCFSHTQEETNKKT